MSADWAQLNDDDPAIIVVSESSGYRYGCTT